MKRLGGTLVVLALLAGVAAGGWAVAAFVPIAKCPRCDGSGQTEGILVFGSQGPERLPVPHRCHACDGSGRVALLLRLRNSR